MVPIPLTTLLGSLMTLKQLVEGVSQMIKVHQDATPEQIAAAEEYLAGKHADYETALAAAKARLAGGGGG